MSATPPVTRVISSFYSYKGTKTTFVFFVSDSINMYVETLQGSIIIPYKDIWRYKNLHSYYILSLQLTPKNCEVHHCDWGFKGLYNELRHWYIYSSICWKTRYLSFGDYCYFKTNPLEIPLTDCDTEYTIDDFVNIFNICEDDPYYIGRWLINYETNIISNDIYFSELLIKKLKTNYELLKIVGDHFNLNNDIVFKIFNFLYSNKIEIC
jgi:hypothetical protein